MGTDHLQAVLAEPATMVCPESFPEVCSRPADNGLMPSRFLWWAIWFGLLTGMAEVGMYALNKFVLGDIVPHSWHVIWMAPLANLILFLVPGIFFWVAARWWPKRSSTRVAMFVFGFLAFANTIVHVSSIHYVAKQLLAAGLASALVRMVGRHPEALHALVSRSTRWLALLVVASAGIVPCWERLAEEWTIAGLPPAAADAPNVLLITLDTVRAANLSLYGYHRRTTPNLERLARSGVCFERALSTAPWTLPSHCSMFLGRYPHELSADWTQPLDGAYPTLAEVLAANGYETAGFVANAHYCCRGTGLARGFAHYEDHPISPGQLVLTCGATRRLQCNHRLRNLLCYHELLDRIPAATVNADFLHWLSRPRQRPFFAFLNYFDAHAPYYPPAPFDTQFGPGRPPEGPLGWPKGERGMKDMRGAGGAMTAQEVQTELDAYDGALAYIDHQLGLLLAELEKRGLLHNTLVIITADHGEQFGEHGLLSHSSSVYLPVLHVPLVILHPSKAPLNKRVHEAVTLRDIPATVMDLLDLKDKFPGRSLRRFFDPTQGFVQSGKEVQFSAADHQGGCCACDGPSRIISEVSGPNDRTLPPWYPFFRGPLHSLVEGTLHYIRDSNGHEELYDFSADPLEQHDLATRPEHREVLEQFRKALKSVLSKPEA